MGARERGSDFEFHVGKSDLPPLEKPKPKEPEFAFRGDALDDFRINPQELTDQGIETDDEGNERVKNIVPRITEKEALEKTEDREERVEIIKALREKVSVLKLEQADSEVQINVLKKQIDETTEDTLPVLTGERIKELKKYQEQKKQIDETLRVSQEKLTRAEAQYRLAFPDFPIDSEGM